MRAWIAPHLKPFRGFGTCLFLVGGSVVGGSLVGCSADVDDLFANGGAAASSANGAGPGAGPGAGDASATSAVSASAANASNQASATSVTDGASSAVATTVAASTAQATSSTGPLGPTVSCGNALCDIDAGESCCLFEPTGGLTCKTQCDFVELGIPCDDPTDCDGQTCCGTLDALQQSYDKVECTNSCNSDNERVFCASDLDCKDGLTCLASNVLPAGFKVCRSQ